MLAFFVIALVFANVQASSACGVRKVSSALIVGGDDATRGEWPWQVSIRKDYTIGSGNYHTCGGTLIGDRYVLTAGHCFEGNNLDPANYEIVLGNHERDTQDATQQSFYVEEIMNHADYKSRTLQNDITLLKLSSTVTYNNYIQPACLPSKDWPAGTDVWITGWGDQETTIDDETLQEITVPIIATATCNQQNWYDGEVYDDLMFCAGLAAGGKDSCQGDSGGPVVVDNGGTFEVIGITSWGYGCADPRNPGVYTRVYYFLDWINARMA